MGIIRCNHALSIGRAGSNYIARWVRCEDMRCHCERTATRADQVPCTSIFVLGHVLGPLGLSIHRQQSSVHRLVNQNELPQESGPSQGSVSASGYTVPFGYTHGQWK